MIYISSAASRGSATAPITVGAFTVDGASENQPKVFSKSKKKRRDLQNHPRPIKKRYQMDGKT